MRLLTIVLTIYSYKQLYAYTYQINLQQIIMFLLSQVCTNSQKTRTYTYQIWSSMYQFVTNTNLQQICSYLPNMVKYVPICNEYVPICKHVHICKYVRIYRIRTYLPNTYQFALICTIFILYMYIFITNTYILILLRMACHTRAWIS